MAPSPFAKFAAARGPRHRFLLLCASGEIYAVRHLEGDFLRPAAPARKDAREARHRRHVRPLGARERLALQLGVDPGVRQRGRDGARGRRRRAGDCGKLFVCDIALRTARGGAKGPDGGRLTHGDCRERRWGWGADGESHGSWPQDCDG